MATISKRLSPILGKLESNLFWSGSVLMATRFLLTTPLSFISGILIARHLGPDTYGLWVLAAAYVSVVSQFISLRMVEPSTRWTSSLLGENKLREAGITTVLSLAIELITGIFAIIVSIGLANIIATTVFQEPRIVQLVLPLALLSFISIVPQFSEATLRITGSTNLLAILQPLESVVRLASIVVIVMVNGSVLHMVWLYVAGNLLVTTIYSVILLKKLRQNFDLQFASIEVSLLLSLLHPMRSYIFSSNIVAYTKIGRDHADKLILGWLTDTTAVGIYSLAKNLMMVAFTSRQTFATLVFPDLCKIDARKDFLEFRQYLRKLITFSLIPTVIAIIVLTIFAEQIILLVGKEQFIESATIFKILLLGILWIPFSWGHQAILAVGKPMISGWTSILSVLLYIAVILVLVPQYGLLGAAFGSLFQMGANTVISIWQMKVAVVTIETKAQSQN